MSYFRKWQGPWEYMQASHTCLPSWPVGSQGAKEYAFLLWIPGSYLSPSHSVPVWDNRLIKIRIFAEDIWKNAQH